MTYLGSPPATQAFAPGTDTFNGDGTTTVFTLSRNVATVNDIQVVVNNVVQQPTAYSVSVSTLTFTAAPSAGTANIYVRYLSTNLVTIAPQQGSVTPASLSTPNALYWDTSGNVGVGTTNLNAWAAGSAIQMAGGQGYSRYGMTNNTYYDGTNYRYISTDLAGLYGISSGVHLWFNAPSGTAGNVATFTERMRIDSSGNVGIGVSSPADTAAYGGKVLDIKGPTYLRDTSGGSNYFSSGVVGGATYLQANGTGNFIAFSVNNAERMRIDSSGNLIVGTTATTFNERLSVYLNNASTAPAAFFYNVSGATTGSVLYVQTEAVASTTWKLFSGRAQGGAERVIIYGNGNIQNINNSYGAISDIKLKENIVDATPKLDKLMQVKVRNYNLKIEPEHKQIGVIAQELEQIFPSMIEEAPDRDAEDNLLDTTTKSVKYSVFVPILIKAIQEQQAMIEELKTKVAALEAR